MPPPLIVMVADLDEVVDVFSETLTVIAALLDPDALLTVHQLLSLVTVHDTLEEIVKSLLPFDDVKDRLVGSTLI